MRERVRQLGGDLKIESGNGGTRITATFPSDFVAEEGPQAALDLAS